MVFLSCSLFEGFSKFLCRQSAHKYIPVSCHSLLFHESQFLQVPVRDSTLTFLFYVVSLRDCSRVFTQDSQGIHSANSFPMCAIRFVDVVNFDTWQTLCVVFVHPPSIVSHLCLFERCEFSWLGFWKSRWVSISFSCLRICSLGSFTGFSVHREYDVATYQSICLPSQQLTAPSFSKILGSRNDRQHLPPHTPSPQNSF